MARRSSIDMIESMGKMPRGSVDNISMGNMSIDIVYSVVDAPPLPVAIMLSIQQFITVTCSIILMPFIVSPALCMSNTDPGKAYILATMYFVIGLTTLFQILFGIRLPVVQGMAPSYLIPILNLMSLSQFSCPLVSNALVNEQENIKSVDSEVWVVKIREIQASIAISSVVQILLSVTGLLNVITKIITPLVVIPTLCLVGLSFISHVTDICAGNWIISLCTTFLIILCSQHLQQIPVPFVYYKKSHGIRVKWFTLFKFFPMIISVMIMWVLCHVLTIYDVFPVDDPARTDTNNLIVKNTDWFKIPYPGQWGAPIIRVPGVITMIYSAFVVIIESVGSYYACARLTGVPTPPKSAINRGIFVEGIGSLLAGLMGTGSGCNSATESIAGISITKAATRRAVQIASVYMLFCGMFTKLAAAIVSIPAPIIGGLMIVSFSMTAGIGLSLTKFVNFNSSRNVFILGFSIWFGLAIPEWVADHSSNIQTGNVLFNEVFSVLFSSSMFVGGITAFILDRTIPGSFVNEDGDQWLDSRDSDEMMRADESIYDFAYFAECNSKVKCFRYIPICPTYRKKSFEE